MIFGVQSGFSKIFENVFSNYFFGGGSSLDHSTFSSSNIGTFKPGSSMYFRVGFKPKFRAGNKMP